MRENVRLWLEEYRFDGLRFDATHALDDRSPTHIVHELTEYGRRLVAPRRIYVSIENESQDTAFVRHADDTAGVDGLWNEDWHHAAFVALTGRREAYFTDYRGTADEFASMARRNLLYQGQWYSWQKQPRGSDGSRHPHAAFACFLENHDQVANTGTGQPVASVRRSREVAGAVDAALAGSRRAAAVPGAGGSGRGPFSYFADHQPPLFGCIVRDGRLQFLSQFPSLSEPETRERVPDPADETAFRVSPQVERHTRGAPGTQSLH